MAVCVDFVELALILCLGLPFLLVDSIVLFWKPIIYIQGRGLPHLEHMTENNGLLNFDLLSGVLTFAPTTKPCGIWTRRGRISKS